MQPFSQFRPNTVEVVKSAIDCRKKVLSLKAGGSKIGFVPTMGALHEGHLELLKHAAGKCDSVVASIFVNPAQFNNPDDYARYPKMLDSDLEKLKAAGCDMVFVPERDEMYNEAPGISISFPGLDATMEGRYRPGHFQGVGLVVAKLLNIVAADYAFFGQKDWQQVLIIKQLVRDLMFATQVVTVPTVREADGLAMSSRNLLLSVEQRSNAAVFIRSMKEAKRRLLQGASVDEVKKLVAAEVEKLEGVELEYFEVADRETLAPINSVDRDTAVSLFIAGYVGTIRLIDNIFLQEDTTL